MPKNLEGSFENPIAVNNFEELHNVEYLLFVNINGRKELKCTKSPIQNVVTISKNERFTGRVNLRFYYSRTKLDIGNEESWAINSNYLKEHDFEEAKNFLLKTYSQNKN